MSVQTSGSISLDTGSLSGAVVSALEPILTQLDDNMRHLAGMLSTTVLEPEAAEAVLEHYLPLHYLRNVEDARHVAGLTARTLTKAGYALVAIAEPALSVEAARSGFTGLPSIPEPLAPVVDPRAAQQTREDEWFTPGRDD